MVYLGNYINGSFHSPKKNDSRSSKKFKDHISPADRDDKIFCVPAQSSPLRELVFKKGKSAYLRWSKLSLKQRVTKLQPLKEIITKKWTDLSGTISRETGKPLWESEVELKAVLGKIDFVLGPGLDRIKVKKIPKAQGQIRFKSRGLLLVIGPFNFPIHLPLGQILPALVAGNSVIFKPSEKTPASGQNVAEMFHQLQLPEGVFQMIQGGSGVSKKLSCHKQCDGVLFTGSFEVGQKIKEALVKHYDKILALEMGGYNSALIWDYKNKALALEETIKGCFLSAGQRCSSTSQILVHKNRSEEFIKDFVEMAKSVSVNHWSRNPFMGPVINELAVKRFFVLQKKIIKEGGEILLEGKRLKKNGYYVTPGIYKMNPKKSKPATKETFTPQVIFYEVESLDQAVELINYSGYGLVLSLFTNNSLVREEIFHRAKVGLINYNLSTIGASPWLPFGGLGKSGNDRPAGSFAFDFCVSPVAERSPEVF